MDYIQQDPFGVVYCGFFTPSTIATFDADMLTVLDRTTISYGRGVSVDIAIIGESHFAIVSVDGQPLFIECLACISPTRLGFDPDIIDRFDSGKRRIMCSMECGDLRVFVIADLRPAESPLFRIARRRKWDDGGTDELIRVFPGELEPCTRVRVRRVDDGVVLNTLHEYEFDGGQVVPIETITRISLNK